MPTYQYKCSNCGNAVEIMHSIKDAPRKKCPRCGKNGLRRMISGGGGVIFKGPGFYCNDYPSKEDKNEKS